MQQGGRSKRQQFLKQYGEWIPYLMPLGVLICVVAAVVLTSLERNAGRIFSSIYSSESWCFWRATAKSWLDENEDGKWDTNEIPLPGVQFSIGRDDPVSDFKGEGHGEIVTDQVCDSAYLVPISAAPPDGYRPTTSTIITSAGGDGEHGPFLFGFTYLPGVPTITPQPLTLTPHS